MFRAMVVMVVLLATAITSVGFAAETADNTAPAVAAKPAAGQWRLAIQTYSFKEYSLYEAIDKTVELGLTNIESYPGQKLSVEKPDVRFSHRMPADLKQEVKDKLAKSGVKMVCYGVTGLRNNEASCREVFDFAKDMGIEVIVAEPNVLAFDIVDKLCKEYNIKVAIHNHPKPSTYWSPDTILTHIKGHSELIGACADVGHWMRSGLDPVECLKNLEGRIVSLHFKDLNEFGDPNAHDVVWGSGKGNVPAMLTELKRQGGSYIFSIEYEHNWTTSMPEIKASIEYYNKTIGGL